MYLGYLKFLTRLKNRTGEAEMPQNVYDKYEELKREVAKTAKTSEEYEKMVKIVIERLEI